MNEFELYLDRNGFGNMKGAAAAKALPGTTVLYGAEMDFPTAPCIRKAVADFAMKGMYGYTLADDDYRQSVCGWMKMARNFEIQPIDIVTTLGTLSGLNTALRAFTKEGEGVIVQHPSYFNFDKAIANNGRKVVPNSMKEEQGVYSMDWEDLEQKMSDPNNTFMVLCNPHNPTSKVFHPDELKRIAELAEKYGIIVFCDEIFAETATKGHEVRPYIEFGPKHGITATSMGKAFSFTGVNHGNLLIVDEVLKKRFLAQRKKDHYGSVDPFFYTALRAAYTEEGWAWVQAMNQHTLEIYEMMTKAFAERMPLLSLSPLEGSYVCWLDLRKLNMSREEREKFLTEEVKLLANPGEDFGPDGAGFMRLNITTTKAVIENFLNNLEAAYKKRGY